MTHWQRTMSLRAVEGPLGPMLESYASFLNEEAYSHESFPNKTWFVIGLSRWLHKRHLDLGELTLGVGERFLQHRVPRRSGDPTTLRHFLTWMHGKGLISVQALQVHEKSEVEVLVEEYSAYLLTERGLASTSAVAYASLAHRFSSTPARVDDRI